MNKRQITAAEIQLESYKDILRELTKELIELEDRKIDIEDKTSKDFLKIENRIKRTNDQITKCEKDKEMWEEEVKKQNNSSNEFITTQLSLLNITSTSFMDELKANVEDFLLKKGPSVSWSDISIPKLPVGQLFNSLDSKGKSICCNSEELQDFSSNLRNASVPRDKFPNSKGELRVSSIIHNILDQVIRLSGINIKSITISGNVQSVSTPSGTKKPDSVLQIGKFDIFRGEDKENLLDKAKEDLMSKFRSWNSAFYGDMPSFLGYVSTKSEFQLFEIFPNMEVKNPFYCGSFFNRTDILMLIRWIFVVVTYSYLRIENEEWLNIRQATTKAPNVVTLISNDDTPYIRKTYKNIPLNLEEFYKASESIDGIEKLNSISSKDLYLTPVGVCRKPHSSEIMDAFKQIANTLSKLHEIGWCHFDLRWPNVITIKEANNERKWILIDFEYCQKIGEQWPDVKLKANDNIHDDKVSPERTDIYQLGIIFSELNLDLDKDIKSICDRLIADNISDRLKAFQESLSI